jgi:hypothetical protein
MVLIVDEYRVLIFKPKRQTPVPADAHAPVVRKRSGKPVELPSRSIHVRRSSRIIQRKQLQTQPGAVLGLNPALRTRPEELLQAAMAEALDHDV